ASRYSKHIFYLLWFIVNLIQAGRTGLFDDEAYYWMYAKFPAWGYFDHPPMIGLLIRAGYNFFANELGLRLFVVFISTATLYTIDSLLEQRNDRLFYTIALSMGLLQIGGIIAVPDLPLLFFVALFFLAYKKFTIAPSIWNTVLLGLIVALMFYSKYHGILIVFFTLISNLKLFTRWQTYLAGLIALILFFPHLYWQHQHNYPSIQYHLFERNAIDYRSGFTIEFIIGQVLLAGPLIGWLLLWAAGKHKPASLTEKALRWCFFGIYGLFLVSTLKGQAEANWTVPAFVSLIVLSHQYLTAKPKAAQWVYRLFIPSFMLVLLVRVYMMIDIAPLPIIKKDEFHRTQEWANAIKNKAAGRPVVFINSYQRASQYWFYAGDSSFSLNNIYYRRSNFNFWPLEASLQGREVLVLSPDNWAYFSDTVKNTRKLIGATVVNPYFSFSQIAISGPKIIQAKAGKVETDLEVLISEATKNAYGFKQFDTAQILLTVYFRDDDPGLLIPTNAAVRSVKDSKLRVNFDIPTGLKHGKYRAKWAINCAIPDWPSLNSSSYLLEVASHQ
ncbi:MAG: ArnT family glycosyltransferase, partial [Chitinophagaceae bacterium]